MKIAKISVNFHYKKASNSIEIKQIYISDYFLEKFCLSLMIGYIFFKILN